MWPCLAASVGDVEVTGAVLVVYPAPRRGANVVLVGFCVPDRLVVDQAYRCAVEAAGARWAFDGLVLLAPEGDSSLVRVRAQSLLVSEEGSSRA
jgi:hypothetical protein